MVRSGIKDEPGRAVPGNQSPVKTRGNPPEPKGSDGSAL